MRLHALVFATPVLGAAVAFLEFPCTGQVFAPIVYVLHNVASERASALAWLVLYNLCFILPLVGVFLLVLFAVTSEQLTALYQRHMAKTKFALAAVFLGLVALLALITW